MLRFVITINKHDDVVAAADVAEYMWSKRIKR